MLKGKVVERLGNIQRVKSGVCERTRAKEGQALLMRYELRDCVKKYKQPSSRLM